VTRAHLLALDQGTSSSRSIVFDRSGRIVAMAQREFRQIFPQPGWVEHDPTRSGRPSWHRARGAGQAGSGRDIAAIGITNQRETTVLWNRRTGQPLHNAIVWQDRRTEPLCRSCAPRAWRRCARQHRPGHRRLLLGHQAPLAARPRARRARSRRGGELAFGTVDSWLLWKLTGGRVHATDVSNASRTLLFDIHHNQWDDELLARCTCRAACCPQVHPSSHVYGETDAAELLGAPIPIAGIAGDQQARCSARPASRPGWPRTPTAPAASC
jgi:glycerol kinase